MAIYLRWKFSTIASGAGPSLDFSQATNSQYVIIGL